MSPDSPRQADSTIRFVPRRKNREPSGSLMHVNLTPAIDITFNLLIFFLVATTFKAAEGILPSTVPSKRGILAATPLPISPIKIRVRQFGEDPGDYAVTIDNWRRAPATFTELTQILEALQDKPGFDQHTPVIIFAGDDVHWDHVVNCFNAIRRVNLHREGRHTYQNISFAASST